LSIQLIFYFWSALYVELTFFMW